MSDSSITQRVPVSTTGAAAAVTANPETHTGADGRSDSASAMVEHARTGEPTPAPGHPPTRRTVMTAIVSAAALANAAPISAAAVPPVGRLVRPAGCPEIAARWALVYGRWRDRENSNHASATRYEARVTAATGMTYADYLALDADDPRAIAYSEARRRVPTEDEFDLPEEEDDEGFRRLYAELDPVIEEIMSRPVRSLADLALQARAVAVYSRELWSAAPDRPRDIYIRLLVENLCGLAGVEVLPGVRDIEPLREM